MTVVHPPFGMRSTRFGNGVAPQVPVAPSMQAPPAALSAPAQQFGRGGEGGENGDKLQFGHDGDTVKFGLSRVGRTVLVLAGAAVVGVPVASTLSGCTPTDAAAAGSDTGTHASAEPSAEATEAAKSICKASTPAADVNAVAKALEYLSPAVASDMATQGLKTDGNPNGYSPAGLAADLVKQYTANLDAASPGISTAFAANAYVAIVNAHPDSAAGKVPDFLKAAVPATQAELGKPAHWGANQKFFKAGQFGALQGLLGKDHLKVTNAPMVSLFPVKLADGLTC